MTDAALRVTVTDTETSEVLGEQILVPGDYVILTHPPCYLDGVQTYPTTGTHVLTVKGYSPQKAGAS